MKNHILSEEELGESLAGDPAHVVRCLQWAVKMGACMKVQTSTFNGVGLSVQEWLDALFMIYGLDPSDLPKFCDGCNSAFSICHALDYKKGGVVTAHHSELHYGVAYLAGKSFTPTHMHYNPLIFAGRVVHKTKAHLAGSTHPSPKNNSDAIEQKGNFLIHDLW